MCSMNLHHTDLCSYTVYVTDLFQHDHLYRTFWWPLHHWEATWLAVPFETDVTQKCTVWTKVKMVSAGLKTKCHKPYSLMMIMMLLMMMLMMIMMMMIMVYDDDALQRLAPVSDKETGGCCTLCESHATLHLMVQHAVHGRGCAHAAPHQGSERLDCTPAASHV